jgi:hypothetical protein
MDIPVNPGPQNGSREARFTLHVPAVKPKLKKNLLRQALLNQIIPVLWPFHPDAQIPEGTAYVYSMDDTGEVYDIGIEQEEEKVWPPWMLN